VPFPAADGASSVSRRRERLIRPTVLKVRHSLLLSAASQSIHRTRDRWRKSRSPLVTAAGARDPAERLTGPDDSPPLFLLPAVNGRTPPNASSEKHPCSQAQDHPPDTSRSLPCSGSANTLKLVGPYLLPWCPALPSSVELAMDSFPRTPTAARLSLSGSNSPLRRLPATLFWFFSEQSTTATGLIQAALEEGGGRGELCHPEGSPRAACHNFQGQYCIPRLFLRSTAHADTRLGGHICPEIFPFCVLPPEPPPR
jgi:hypothetical protein